MSTEENPDVSKQTDEASSKRSGPWSGRAPIRTMNLRSIGQVASGLIAVIALVIGINNNCENRKANQVFEDSLRPQLSQVNSHLDTYSFDPNTNTAICRYEFVLYNAGQSSSLIRTVTRLAYGESLFLKFVDDGRGQTFRDDRFPDIHVNVWESAPSVVGYFDSENLFFASMTALGGRLPMQVAERTTTVVHVEAAVNFGQNRIDTIPATIEFEFPDEEPITAFVDDICGESG